MRTRIRLIVVRLVRVMEAAVSPIDVAVDPVKGCPEEMPRRESARGLIPMEKTSRYDGRLSICIWTSSYVDGVTTHGQDQEWSSVM